MGATHPATAAPARVRDALLSRVEDRLRELFATETSRWSAVDARAAVPVDVVAALVGAGGKRLRPAFCLNGFLAGGGDPAREPVAVDVAAALEVLHAFALLHDDVLDDSPLRRGEPTAHERHEAAHRAAGWAGEPRRFGEGVAALAGDLAHIYADRLVSALSRPPGRSGTSCAPKSPSASTWTFEWRPSGSRIPSCPAGSRCASPGGTRSTGR